MRGLIVTAILFCVILALFAVNRRAEPLAFAVDEIVIHKQAHTMDLLRDGTVMREYRVALGRGGLMPKARAGDNRVPEGEYIIVAQNSHSASPGTTHRLPDSRSS